MSSSDATENNDNIHDIVPVSGLYENWFLDYASYVILERAVPNIDDGLKPVQRRILHAMKEMDDGRFNKVANVIGSTMQYHPHGDASIGDAIVTIGQKELLLDMQGNWGDVRTGDGAAAPRYIEARLSKFALDVVFNGETTEWQASYDGRKKEPVTFPVKFPLLLVQGVEGIAVGLSTKILPHNFIELIEASIAHLKNKKFQLYPDFITGGSIDAALYNEGQKGGKIRARAKIEEYDNKTLLIKEIPFGTTTNSIIDSIIKANDNGKIKIKKVIDNTAKDLEIQVQLVPGTDPDITIDALYAFTDCEVSISPNACVIVENRPEFLSVNDMLKISTDKTKELLRQELEIRKSQLQEKALFLSLEKIFIENKIYRKIEDAETWEAVLQIIDKGLTPFKKQFYRTITQDDIVRLTEIKIKRISKFDGFKADEFMKAIGAELKETINHLANLNDYAINYFAALLKKYGKGRERKTEIKAFDTINAAIVAANNQKLYVNREDGFMGYGLKKDEYIADCSDIDDVIVFRKDGICVVKKIGEKVFVGKDVIHIAIFRKGDERMVYNMIYLDGKTGRSMVKRFQVLGVTRDKEYDLSKGEKGSKVLYFTANPNAEAEKITVTLTTTAKARNKIFDYDFSELEIKARTSQGNILTEYPVKKISLKEAGLSTLGGVQFWFDAETARLNTQGKGLALGEFGSEDQVIVFYKDGNYEITGTELTNRYEGSEVMLIENFDPEKIYSVLYFEGKNKAYYIKRFGIDTSSLGKKFNFVGENEKSELIYITANTKPKIKVEFAKGKYVTSPTLNVDIQQFAEVKSYRAIGIKFSGNKVIGVNTLDSSKKDASKSSGAAPTLFD
ncbi:MAG: DNA gyrase/topoisomerase IV subunit A [Cytophagaceae bacterium]|nr:DNA gyrase/topoisomerase IV subunit A [Cytophagaceae bacterium]